jgi:lambda family phage tail tape measure protein
MGMLARLGVVLGLDSAEFQQGLEKADRQLSKLVDKLPALGVTGAAAFAAMTYQAMKFADELSDTAKANDMTVSSILKLQEALMVSGGEAENAGKMLNSFTNYVDKAASGNQDAQDSFTKMGITLKELGTLSNEDLFGRVTESLSKIDDTITRNAKAFDVFGKAAKGVDFRSFNDELQNGIGLNDEWTKSIEDAGAAWDMLGKQHHQFVTQFTAGMGTVLKDTLDYFDQLTEKSSFVAEAVKVVFQTVAVVASDLQFIIAGIAAELEHTVENVKAFWRGGIDAAINENIRYEKDMQERADRLEEFQRRIMSGGTEAATEKKSSPTGARREVKASPEAKRMEQMLAMARLISGEYKRHLDFNLANLKTQGDMAFMTENQRKIQEAINKVADDTDKKLSEIQKKREEAAAHGANQKVLDELDKQAAAVQKLGEDYQKLTEIEMQAQIQAQNTFEYGWNKAFGQFIEDSQNAARLGAGYFETMTGAMNSAIDTFVQTGKFSFQDFTASIIRNIIAMEMKMQAAQLFRMGMMAMGFGGQYNPASASFVGPPAPHADGGFAGAGQAYLVGERGPELFIPQGSGSVIPSNRSMGGQQAVQQTVYNGPYIANMSAIDTQSATQFLAKNKQTIWAVNQSAQRSLPVSK